MEDEFEREFVGKISKITTGIKSQGRTKEDVEVIQKILKNLTPPFKSKTKMIQFLISCTKDFIKESFLGRLEELENELRQSRENGFVSQVENKFDWIIDIGCSHHMTGDMNKFFDFKSHDGGIVKVGNNAT